ncbi:DNA topoisomerase domain containing protein [Entamoeba histolytica HM-1:IMSS-B]|uniref:DNA topoisomerase n=6 Tax=Entamoeba histolytica TaxID=5759 RepID=C4LZR4_ENTH1|nr:DNA topoisomerase III, putative [Entamoeba histolytica HM-1:IMSS]EMD44500.1 DNA topoisomerase alpha, putative [Entamoeba histolytica KU27]EMH75040.1 DNA topoisomerase domain containing protein [Entamoeba histolytica HM-1:IMSS-B]EMS14068.1 DNA topoisomerase 3-alpha, putative [Entamoeba histolytica HM-3:IMSS]ENY64878.1 DNA topoisomerase 3-alpha, putative [Entamoeba histolytica HM-1:IMSS-A]GAT94369.1 DNA topoisomerase III putative [Entamoeba histolytica]|eukprot:XP_656880.1 DNA topoisomerase III, putative [Entamoeba histolytica HM-1:IMSS]
MNSILHVAEKPSVASAISYTLSRGTCKKTPGLSKYNSVFSFEHEFKNDGKCTHYVTSVAGHLKGIDFTTAYRSWGSCDPEELFTAPIEKSVPSNMKKVELNLKSLAKKCQVLVLWLDCDREGENISFEVIEVCSEVNSKMKVWRAHFNSLVPNEIIKAYNTLTAPNKHMSEAVDVRQEIDLRTGAAFTRFQTTLLKNKSKALEGKVLSYGACQFPTLGFVVDRYYQIKAFTKETFYKINCVVEKNSILTEFHWDRNRLFDRLICDLLYEDALEYINSATITEILEKSRTNFKPLPLTTVDLQKACSKYFKISSNETMNIAEKLYNSGLISYPRTETNIFPSDMNHRKQIEMFQENRIYSSYVQELLNGKMKNPRNGKATDKSHPPIHPTRNANLNDLSEKERKIYDFIVRNYLANMSDDARGFETKIGLQVGNESFHCNGLMITERNYLNIFPFRKWSDKEIPEFHEGEKVQLNCFEVSYGETSPPKPLTEPELIQLMDKNGIGTDATIAQHIQKIQEREYVIVKQGSFIPTNLGLALVEGYDSMGFEFSRPQLRAETEKELTKICSGESNKDDVINTFIEQYEELYERAQFNKSKLVNAVKKLMPQ